MRTVAAERQAGAVMILLSSFVLGLVFGSFLNVVIYRLKNGRELYFGRSFCPECKTQLRWYDLVPILSFVWLGGRCRYCRKKISWQYPVVEILSGLIWVGVFYPPPFMMQRVGDLAASIYHIFILSSLLIVAVYDFKWLIIPDKIIYPAVFISILYNVFISFKLANWQTYFLEPLLVALIVFVFFFLFVYFSSGRAMGLGDAKLTILIALFLSPLAAFIAFNLAFILGGIYGIILLTIGKKSLKSQIAFGPLLVIGAIISFFMSDLILEFIIF